MTRRTHLAAPIRRRSQTTDRASSNARCALVLTALVAATGSARAVDGCLVLLCLAAPSWSLIAQCEPAVHEALADVARGRPFPSCSMTGAGNAARHQWSTPPTFCPPQYTQVVGIEAGAVYTCDYDGAVEVDIDGAFWSRTWWNVAGDTVTEYAPIAKARLGSWETRFDDDYAAWLLRAAPAPGAPCLGC